MRAGSTVAGLLFVCWLAVPAHADDPARVLVREGNEHYAAGRYTEALRCYDQAAERAHRRQAADIMHNQAAAHFRLGDWQAARDLWVRLKEAGDPQLEARTRYNLGNCDYAEALAAAERQDVAAAQRHLNDAIQQYRSALRLDPTLADARANLELAELLKRQLAEQQSQTPQSQSSTQPSEGQRRPDQNQPASQPVSQPQKPPPAPESQPQTDQSGQPAQSSESPSDEQEQSEQQQSGQNESQEQQSRATPQESARDQRQDGEQQDNEARTVPVEMTREQAERLLQMIRDAEKTRREMLARQQAARQKPVERDW